MSRRKSRAESVSGQGCSLKDYIEHVTNLKYEKEKNSVAKSMKPESTAFPMLFNAVKGG